MAIINEGRYFYNLSNTNNSLRPNVLNFALMFLNLEEGDNFKFIVVCEDKSYKFKLINNRFSSVITCYGDVSSVNKKFSRFFVPEYFTIVALEDFENSDLIVSSNTSFRDFILSLENVSYFLIKEYNLTLPCYFNLYDSIDTYNIDTAITLSSYSYMMSCLQVQTNELASTTQVLLSSLSDKLDTLDNLNILSQADFTPLLQLSSLSDTLALLNPTITTQNQVTSELNSNVEQLLPVRAKYGEPVAPVSPSTVILSLQGRHKLEITRKSEVNSILTLFEKDGNILGYFFDIDYARYKNLENYNQLYLSYDSADYDINLLPIIGYDD